MAPHSSTLAWKIPWMEEPGGLQSMGSLTVGHNWATSLSLFTFLHWRRKWQPTPVFLPGESQGRGSLVGCRLWGRTESDWSDLAAAAALGYINKGVVGFQRPPGSHVHHKETVPEKGSEFPKVIQKDGGAFSSPCGLGGLLLQSPRSFYPAPQAPNIP